MTEPTKRPWKITYQMITDSIPSTNSGYDFTNVIARMVREHETFGADAELIVRAVNSHEALLQVAKCALDMAHDPKWIEQIKGIVMQAEKGSSTSGV